MTLTFKVPPLASGKELCDIDRGYFRATKNFKKLEVLARRN